ncbi:MAG: caspase domain-containing protein [Cyanobacteriota bacterium]
MPLTDALKTLLLGFAGLLLWPAQAPAGNLAVKDPQGTTLFAYGTSQALLIWAGDYQNPFWKKLNNIRNEVGKVEAELKRQGFQVTVIANPKATELRGSIEAFVQRYGFQPDSRLVIYYAGHGWTRNNTDGYLVPIDAPDASTVQGDIDFAKRALSMEQIMSWSKQMEAKHVLFVFDSCFSGAIFKVRSASSPPKYLERKMSLPVRQFLTAGDANEEVPAQSLFTPLLVRGLEGAADYNRDGYVTGSELGGYLPEAMASYTTSQNPQYGKIRDPRLDEGDLVFQNPSPSPLPLPEFRAPVQPPPARPAQPDPPRPAAPLATPPAQPPSAPTVAPPAKIPGATPALTSTRSSVTGESIMSSAQAEDQARLALPRGAVEERSQCKMVNVAGTDRHRCTIWYALPATSSTGLLP